MKKYSLYPLGMLWAGAALGVLSRWADWHTQNIGNLFSQVAIWILLCVWITLASDTERRAMGNVFAFCGGMLFAYYGTAFLWGDAYGTGFVLGWAAVACLSPWLARVIRRTRGNRLLGGVVNVGILGVSVLSSVLLFDRLRMYDFLIDGLLAYRLFSDRGTGNCEKKTRKRNGRRFGGRI